MDCAEMSDLLEEYAIATKAYSNAVACLTDKAVIELSRLSCEHARLAVDQHVAIHRCLSTHPNSK